jgi:mannosyl-oligosaccharide alpha-1,2-mannosidase
MPLSKYDPESGLPGLPGASPTRFVRRYVARRGRWIVGLLILVVVAVYYLDLGPPGTVMRMRPPSRFQEASGGEGQGQGLQGLEGIWEDEPPEEPQGWGGVLPWRQGQGKDSKSPTHAEDAEGEGGVEGEESGELPFVVDQYGDHFYGSLPGDIPPAHPDLTLLPSPAELFPEIDLDTHFRAPKPPSGWFSREKMDQIYYVVPDEPKAVVGVNTLPSEGSFAARWSGPDTWEAKPAGTVKKVQWSGFEEGKKWETAPQRQVRKERREAVRRGFAHAWQAYKDHAWGEWANSEQRVSRQTRWLRLNWTGGVTVTVTVTTISALTPLQATTRSSRSRGSFRIRSTSECMVVRLISAWTRGSRE